MDRRRLLLGVGAIAAPAIIRPARAQVPMTGAGKGAMPGNIVASSAPPGFNPLQLITGQGAFLRADIGVVVTGNQVTQWTDQSSFNNSPTVVATTNITWSATGFNTSFAGITVADNSANGLNAGFDHANTTYSFFMLIQTNSSSGGNLRYGGFIKAGNDTTTPNLTLFSSGTPGFGCFSNATLGNGGAGISLSNTTNYLLGFVADGANANIWKNAVVQGAGTAFSSSIGGGGCNIDIGSGGANAAGAIFAFYGITQRVMNGTDWGNLKTWTNSNWGTSF